jgi:hypothetical protein
MVSPVIGLTTGKVELLSLGLYSPLMKSSWGAERVDGGAMMKVRQSCPVDV